MGLCATPSWARKQLRTRVIEGVSNVEGGVTGCAGWSLVYRLPDVPSRVPDLHVRLSVMPCGWGARWAMRRGNHTMILPIYHAIEWFTHEWVSGL